jgi:hypothetical protein
MRSPNYFIIKPYNGVRYDNIRKFGDTDFIISASIEDHTVTNRLAVVVSTPFWYEGPISEGDIVIVHHNTFRLYYDMKGREASSWCFYKDDIYMLEYEQIYMYKKDECEWMPTYPYCFVKPLRNDMSDEVVTSELNVHTFGTIEFLPEENMGLKIGDTVSFRPGSEYEFKIDDDKLYRIKLKNLCLTI